MLDDPQLFLPELWATYARYQPQRTALVCGDRRRSWRQFNQGLNRVANRLLADGIRRGDRVAIFMQNSVDMIEAMFGIVKAGGCVVPLSTLLTPDQLATLINDCRAVGIFASAGTLAAADAALPRCPSVRSDMRVVAGASSRGWSSFDAWLSGDDAEPGNGFSMDDDFNIIYSSGTTGLPKGITQTHRARQHFAYSNAMELRFDNNSIALATTALYSNGSWFMLLAPLLVGATAVAMESFDADAFFAIVARERITHSFMVPTQFAALADSPSLAGADLSSLRMLLSAGSPLRAALKLRVIGTVSPNLFELYGFAEGLATIIKPEEIAERPLSVGRPLMGFDLRIIDDEGRELPPGQPGEVVGYGAGMMRGYFEKPDATESAIWRDPLGRTFLRSGDIGMLDEDGFLYIVDRKKDMILSGGLNVFPADIEAVIAEHPDVADVSVIGMAHEKWGETPMALIIPRAGCAPDPEALREWANQRLAKPQRVHRVELRRDFPRNALGKVLKRELRELYRAAPDA